MVANIQSGQLPQEERYLGQSGSPSVWQSMPNWYGVGFEEAATFRTTIQRNISGIEVHPGTYWCVQFMWSTHLFLLAWNSVSLNQLPILEACCGDISTWRFTLRRFKNESLSSESRTNLLPSQFLPFIRHPLILTSLPINCQ